MAASTLEIDPAIAHLKAPYVGVRPFERTEKAIFFGRELDAGFLKDKIFSARLTLLYAPSGVGKSSILRTLVTPALEEQHAWVRYFDNWTGDDPCAAMKTRLVKFASELGLRDAGTATDKGPATLTDIISRIATADDRTAILILDQFEEFLVAHGKQLDPLRKELAALVRASGLDVRVVLSLRQEFLAALEPFRNEILNLFQSTYLLDSLDEQGLRDAIEKPVEFFGGKYEPELTDQLMADLRATEDRETLASSKAQIDLPMMQIVCERLWQETVRRDQKTLTLSLYKKELGGADKILETYVRGVMPKRWSDKLLTAKLMRLLAPASGLKKPYTAAELAENEGLDKERVATELDRLKAERILREREYHGQKLYELQHDAFVRFVSPWRDDILRQEKVRRRLSRVAIGACVLLVFAGYYVYSGLWHDRNLIRDLAKESLQERRNNAEMSFDSATTDLLFRWKSFTLLNHLLHNYEKFIPDGYGLANAPPPRDINKATPTEACDFLCVHYSADRRADDEGYINAEWRYLATSYFALRGIPVPTKLQFKPEQGYASTHYTVTSGNVTLLDTRKIPIKDDSVFLSRTNLKGPARDFFDQYRSKWPDVPAQDIAPFGPYTVVPSWLRPVWKVSGSPATDVRGLPAIYLASALLKNPEPLFGDNAMQVLLTNARKNYPETVSEALEARGYDNLRKDLAQLVSVKHGESLTNLPVILDALAAYPASDPANTPEAVANKVSDDLHTAEAKIPRRLAGPWKRDAGEPTKVPPSGPDYSEIQSYIPGLELAVKVYMGKGLQDTWFNERAPILNPRLYELRDKLLTKYGVELRPPLVYTPDVDDPLPPSGYRIETVASRAPQCMVPAVTPRNASDADVNQFIDTVGQCIVASRAYWVMAEDTSTQRLRTGPAIAAWLDSQYSLTDQKFLMRAVLTGRDHSTGTSSAPGNGLVAPEDSLQHADWLLRSLVFWTQVDDPRDTMKLADSLRDTQRARLTAVKAYAASNAPVGKFVGDGIRELQADQVRAAQASFSKAVAEDRAAAERQFLVLYPGSLKVSQLHEAAAFCNAAAPPYYNADAQDVIQKRIDLEETLKRWSGDLTPDQARRYGLCLLSAYSSSSHGEQLEIATALEKQHSNPADWSPQEARWLGEKILSEYNPYTDSDAFRDGGAILIKSAMIRLPEADSRRTFGFVMGDTDQFYLTKMNGPGPKTWRLHLLRELADARPEPVNLFDLASQLYQIDRKEELEEVLRLTDRAKQGLPNEADPQQRVRDLALVYYYRASALERLSDLGTINPNLQIGDHRAEADENLEQLQRIKDWEEYAATTESEFISERGNYTKAIELDRQAMAHFSDSAKDDSSWYEVLLTSQLLANDPKGAAETANLAKDRADKLKNTLNRQTEDEQASLMFTAALGQLVTGSESMEETGRDFLSKDHPYVPYIAMMLYARIASAETQQEAKGVLNERWEKADRPHWKQRLQGGDETAWREMLIGLYLDQLQPGEIFDQLKDEQSFAKSDLRFLPMSRQDMLCEAYFYSALLAESKKDMRARDADLRKVLDTKVVYFTEYDLAKYMLAQENSGH
ncbi:MAG TPA: hypothetical protein VMB19_07455 [Silvibacterium sp.]|nr:hypothetical protein [Silvibacterium sp.]